MAQKSIISTTLATPTRTKSFAGKTASGDFTHTGTVTLTLTPANISASTYARIGNVPLTLTPAHINDQDYSHIGTVSLALTPNGISSFTTIPYLIKAVVNILIDGVVVDYSSLLVGTVNVTRQDNAAATFSLTIKEDVLTRAQLLNNPITINFQAADETGATVDFISPFTGKIRTASANESTPNIITISGYDFAGIHNTQGELLNEEVTTVLDGSIWLDSEGTFSTGFAPIWSIALDDEEREDIVDGVDFFVDTLTGEITVPITSNLIDNPAGVTFSYAVPFDSLAALMDYVAGLKEWTIELDGLTITDYTAVEKQPVISLSNQSVIDTLRKLTLLSGGKIETNRFPIMRAYDEVSNFLGEDKHVFDESWYFRDSMTIGPSLNQLINEQTVLSVAKSYSNITISAEEELANEEAQVLYEISFVGSAFVGYYTNSRKVIAEVRIPKANISSISHVAGGQYRYMFKDPTDIQDSDWTQTTEDDEIVYQLEVVTHALFDVAMFQVYLYHPGADYTLQVNGTKIEYGEENVEDTVEVTGTRPVLGITDVLAGDVYEHAWLETQEQADLIVWAILLTRGNFSKRGCRLPLYRGADLDIGDKVSVDKSAARVYDGIIKLLSYSVNTETAAADVTVEATGIEVV
jgi:hypothetical protein